MIKRELWNWGDDGCETSSECTTLFASPWAVAFEVILPATTIWSGRAFADPLDIVCYAAGGAFAFHFWSWGGIDLMATGR